jgi:hypothetical protein
MIYLKNRCTHVIKLSIVISPLSYLKVLYFAHD